MAGTTGYCASNGDVASGACRGCQAVAHIARGLADSRLRPGAVRYSPHVSELDRHRRVRRSRSTSCRAHDLAVIAYFQVREAKRLREAQIRPFVVLDVDVEYEDETYFFTLRNYGSTLARDIEVEVTPPLTSGLHEDVNQLERLRAWGRSVKTLAPTVERRALFDADFLRREGLPDTFLARIRYWDHERRRQFDEEVTLDLATAQGLGRLGGHKTLDDLHAQVKRIADGLDALSRGR